jgi:hypothetical protein
MSVLLGLDALLKQEVILSLLKAIHLFHATIRNSLYTILPLFDAILN